MHFRIKFRLFLFSRSTKYCENENVRYQEFDWFVSIIILWSHILRWNMCILVSTVDWFLTFVTNQLSDWRGSNLRSIQSSSWRLNRLHINILFRFWYLISIEIYTYMYVRVENPNSNDTNSTLDNAHDGIPIRLTFERNDDGFQWRITWSNIRMRLFILYNTSTREALELKSLSFHRRLRSLIRRSRAPEGPQ